MNRTKIETFDFSYNPVIGCFHSCEYCYAKPIAEKLYGTFKPTFFESRLIEPSKMRVRDRKIFVCSMGDLFGDFIDKEWICKVINSIYSDPFNYYFFLTKNPKRYKEFQFPRNCFKGFSVSNNKDYLLRSEYEVDWISIEPLHEDIKDFKPYNFKWVIIGAETGQRELIMKPKEIWIDNIYNKCKESNISVWIKNNAYYKYKVKEEMKDLFKKEVEVSLFE